MQLQTFRAPLYLGLALSVTLATVGAQSAANHVPLIDASTSAEEMFDNAPYGVDPMVTGPVSAAFKKQQEAAGCDTAVWPDIPAACYPR